VSLSTARRCLTLCLAFTTFAAAAPGDLDLTFNGTGSVVTSFTSGIDEAHSMAVQTDGKIVLAGRAGGDLGLVRYHPNGSLDTSFDGDGKVTLFMYSPSPSFLHIYEDGKILVCGRYAGDIFLIRFNSNGSLDTSFGNNGATGFDEGGAQDFCEDAVVQPDGKILLTGSSGNKWLILRYNADGTLDSTFDGDGKLFTTIHGIEERGSAIALQSNGRIVVGGQTWKDDVSHYALARYLPNGSLDTSFGIGGKVTTSFPGGAACNDLTILGDGKILAAGTAGGHQNEDFSMTRYHSNGAVDMSFGNGGKVVIDLMGQREMVYKMLIGTDGTIYLAGSISYGSTGNPADVALVRCHGNGSLDASFGNGGIVITSVSESYDTAYDLCQAGDKLLVCGYTNVSGQNYDFLLLRYAIPVVPLTLTEAPSNVTGTGAVLTGSINPKEGAAVTAAFEWSSDGVNFASMPADPATVTGNVTTAVTATLQGLTEGATYHYRVTGTSTAGTFKGETISFVAAPAATNDYLVMLALSWGEPSPAFSSNQTNYTLTVPPAVASISLTPTAASPQATVKVNGVSVTSGAASPGLPLAFGDNTFGIEVTAPNGQAKRTYHLILTRAPMVQGALDVTFNDTGIVRTPRTLFSLVSGMALQSDGKVVVAEDNKQTFLASRYNEDGTLDPSFGTGGVVSLSMFGGYTSTQDVAIQADGKILLTGLAYEGATTSYMGVARLNGDGTLDASFGQGGKVKVSVGSGSAAKSVVVQADGKIVLLGTYAPGPGYRSALVRLTKAGKLDASFSGDGKLILPIGDNNTPQNLAIDANGRILVTGTDYRNGEQMFLVRCSSSGAVDSSFGTGGKAQLPTEETSSAGFDVAIQDDGKILFAGYDLGETVVCRYLATGKLDTSFGVNGRKVVPMYPIAMALQRDQYIVLAGMVPNAIDRAAVCRLRPNGALDSDFGTGGLVVTQIDSPRSLYNSLAIDAAGLIVTSGYAKKSAGNLYDLLLSRYQALSLPSLPTQPLPVSTLHATGITFDSATLGGTVDSGGLEVEMWFDYGAGGAFTMSTRATPPTISEGGIASVSATISGLQPHTAYQFRLRASVGGGRADYLGKTLTFTTQNRAPVPETDALTLLPGAVLPLDLLANDSDPDGDSLTIAAFTAIPAAQGKLAKAGAGLIFTAAPTFTGTSFTYTVKDALGLSATATATLALGAAQLELTEWEMPAAGGNYQVQVTADGAWSVVEKTAWISSSPAVFAGTGPATLIVQPNNAKTGRSALIHIAGQPHLVKQKAAEIPEIQPPDPVPIAMVSAPFSVEIPTVNRPAIYTVANMPPGLKMNQSTGVLEGYPSKAWSGRVKVTARNAAGPAPAPVEFDVTVLPMPQGFAGTFQGLIKDNGPLNQFLGSRLEFTITSTGSVSGKVITGSTATSFNAQLHTDPFAPEAATLEIKLKPRGLAPQTLTLALTPDLAEGQLTSPGLEPASVSAWRQIWKAPDNPAALYKRYYSLRLFAFSPIPGVTEGYGFASFSIDPKTGGLKVAGKLPDNSAWLSSTFLGPLGQVLIYQPLYGNRGTFIGRLDVAAVGVTPSHRIDGSLLWYRGPGVADENGFTAVCTAEGGAYPLVPPGGLVFGLQEKYDNLALEVAGGGLDEVGQNFTQRFTVTNPSAASQAHRVILPSANPKSLTVTTLNAGTGVFGGSFIIPGVTAAQNRKATYAGQIFSVNGSIQGSGYFVIPEAGGSGRKLSGHVILRPN
jgi:uncharacterized delta-60 repeat protein